jgi:hypothetical protein
LFSSSFDIENIIFGLRIESDSAISENKTLIILDEIQEAPQALTALKYFQENAPQYHIVSAGSLPGVATHGGISFPVGKVDFLNLHPLDFIEFLTASGNNELVELIERKDFRLISLFKQKYIDWLKDSGLIHKVSRITKPGIPLTAYQDMKSFKLFMPDVGLLAAHSCRGPQ